MKGGIKVMKKNVTIFKVFAVLFFIVAVVMAYKGYDKIANYENSDSYYSDNHNAYVGGDAYNYIINGNYATGYFVLCVGFMLAGISCVGISSIVSVIAEKEVVQCTGNKEDVEKKIKVAEDKLPPL